MLSQSPYYHMKVDTPYPPNYDCSGDFGNGPAYCKWNVPNPVKNNMYCVPGGFDGNKEDPHFMPSRWEKCLEDTCDVNKKYGVLTSKPIGKGSNGRSFIQSCKLPS